MRTILRTLVLTCCLMAFAIVGGGHWAVLQTVAWARMFVTYTQDSGSVRQGLVRTFDGAHPCDLCQKISVGVQKESRDERQNASRSALLGKSKLIAVLPDAQIKPLAQPGELLSHTRVPTHAGRTADSPPTPPPRLG